MAFVEFEGRDGQKKLVNPDMVAEVFELDGEVRFGFNDDCYTDVRGTWDEVIEKLGQATNVYIEKREEATA